MSKKFFKTFFWVFIFIAAVNLPACSLENQELGEGREPVVQDSLKSEQSADNLADDWLVYQSERWGYSLEYPNDWFSEGEYEDMNFSLSHSFANITAEMGDEEFEKKVSVNLDISDDADLFDSLVDLPDGTRSNLPPVRTKLGNDLIDGQPAIYYSDEPDTAGGGTEYFATVGYLVKRDNKVYNIFLLASSQEMLKKYIFIFERMAKSFKFMPVASEKAKTASFSAPSLLLAFSYPAAWGLAEELFFDPPYAEKGRTYFVEFENNMHVRAGGVTRDFILKKDQPSYDFNFLGFQGKSAQEVCRQFMADVCQEISKKAVLMMRLPVYEQACTPEHQPAITPQLLLAIDAPPAAQIPGLIFEYDLKNLYPEDCQPAREEKIRGELDLLRQKMAEKPTSDPFLRRAVDDFEGIGESVVNIETYQE